MDDQGINKIYDDSFMILIVFLFSERYNDIRKYGCQMKKLLAKFQQFMMGRYGIDLLNKHLQYLFFAVLILSIFLKNTILNGVAVVLLIILYYRMFSKKIYQRTQENLKYARFVKQVKLFFKRIVDFPRYKYLKCPTCGQKLRVPRGKGEITVKCSRCHEHFDARS